MVDDAGAAQARALLKELDDHVDHISRKIDIVERRHRRAVSVRGVAHNHRQRSHLRSELYEAHRLIDALHRRYPETLPAEHRRTQAVRG
jgi:hypothetical protein